MNRLLVSLGAAMLLAACSGSSNGIDGSPSPSPTTSAPASGDAPTAEQVAWAGRVCAETSRLRTSIQGLAAAVTTGDGDAQTRASQEVAAITTSVTSLVETVAAAPSSGEDDPDLVAVQTSSEQLRATVDRLATAANDLPGTSGADRARALAAVGDAANASLTALGSTTKAIGTAANDGRGRIGQAFAANSSCSSL